jgi:hypothetical protein
MIITPEIDPTFMIHCKSPRTHFRGERTVELPHSTGFGIDCEEKKGSFILSEGEVNRILLFCLSYPSIDSPANGLFHRDTEVKECKGSLWKRVEYDKDKDKKFDMRPEPHKVNLNVALNRQSSVLPNLYQAGFSHVLWVTYDSFGVTFAICLETE